MVYLSHMIFMNLLSNMNLYKVRKPKEWGSVFAQNVISAYKCGEFNLDSESILMWDTHYNGGVIPNPAFNTKQIVDYWINTNYEKR